MKFSFPHRKRLSPFVVPIRIVVLLTFMTCAAAAQLKPAENSVTPHFTQKTTHPFFSGPVPRTKAILNDANLRDITTVGNSCWAVGERGVLLQSTDAGLSWTSSFVPVDCSLSSVCFLTNQIGFVAGSRFDERKNECVAVLLKTRDGGATWESLLETSNSPAAGVVITQQPDPIHYLRFFDLENAVAITATDRTNGKSQVIVTQDGGETWQPVESDSPKSRWINGDFLSPRNGIIAGESDSYGVLIGEKIITHAHPARSLRFVRGASLNREGQGWLVGDGGLLLGTVDSGVTWRPSSLNAALNDVLDYYTVDQNGSTVCVAGSPGSVILHSQDAGRNWTFRQLPNGVPVHKLRFVDANTVIAVGAMGVVYHSADAGLTWTAARNGSYRAAVLSLATNPEDVPFRMLTEISGDQGFRSVVVQPSARLPRTDVDDRTTAWRLDKAVTRVGGNQFCMDWMFSRTEPMQQLVQDELMKAWATQSDGRVSELLPLRLARLIRIWRPDVVSMESNPKKDHVAALWLRAFAAAEEIAIGTNPGILDQIGLRPWRVSRIVVRQAEGTRTPLRFADDTLQNNLGTTTELITDWCHRAAFRDVSIMQNSHSLADAYHTFDPSSQQATPRHLLEGSFAAPGSDSRRNIEIGRNRQQLEQIAQHARTERAALVGHLRNAGTPLSMIAQVGQVGSELPDELALQQLRHLSDLYLQNDNLEGQIAVLREIARRFPITPAGLDAAEQLFQYYSSQELRYFRQRNGQTNVAATTTPIQQAAARIPGVPMASAAELQPTGNSLPSNGIALPIDRRKPETVLLWNNNGRDSAAVATAWDRLAESYLHQLNHIAPQRAAKPEILLRKAANARRHGTTGAYQSALSQAASTSELYGLLARSELQSTHGTVDTPIPVINAQRALQRPLLDADLSDQCWQDASEIRLRSENAKLGAPDSLLMISWDDEHIYIAGRFEFARGRSSRRNAAADRAHDFDHATLDRINIDFDVDRDYSTAFQFSVDETGQTSDRCWRAKSWNPKWYLAEADDDRVWRFEGAIPLREIGTPVRAGSLWVIRLQRILPGVLQQSLANTNDDGPRQSSEGFGLLRFIRRRK